MMNLFRSDGWVKTPLGPAVPGAQIWLCFQPANVASAPPSPLVPAFSDPGGLVPITFPILTDGFGHYDFYTAAGTYTLVVAYGGLIQQVYPDQSVGGVGSGGGSTLLLETNGASNGDQLLLNLTGAGSVTVSDNGAGTITITGTVFTGPAFKTNGTLNTTQGTLNLVNGTNVTVTSDGSGNVTINSSSVGFGGNGAFFFGPGIVDAGEAYGGQSWFGSNANTANGTLTANQVVVYIFELFSTFTISKASVLATNNAGGVHGTFGIYSFAGNKLLDAGSFLASTGSGVQTNNVNGGTPVTLPPGLYWHAQAADSASAGASWLPGIQITTASATIMGMFVKNAVRVAIAANPLVSGILPATLGTLTPFTPSSTNSDNVCAPLYE